MIRYTACDADRPLQDACNIDHRTNSFSIRHEYIVQFSRGGDCSGRRRQSRSAHTECGHGKLLTRHTQILYRTTHDGCQLSDQMYYICLPTCCIFDPPLWSNLIHLLRQMFAFERSKAEQACALTLLSSINDSQSLLTSCDQVYPSTLHTTYRYHFSDFLTYQRPVVTVVR